MEKPGKTTIMDKSLGILLHFWGVFQFTQAQPSPHPTNNVGRMYPELFSSFNFVHCIGLGGGGTQRKFRKGCTVLMREPRNDRKI